MSLSQAIDKKRIAANFDKAATTYGAHDFVQREVGHRLLEKLDFIKIEPRRILDLGAGTGDIGRALGRRYHKSRIINVDLAPGMLARARKSNPRWFSRQAYLCADIEHLPINAQFCEFAVSNLSLQWVAELDGAFHEIHRVLKTGGLLMFTTLGPDTLLELREAWAEVSPEQRVNQFFDMHDIGDAMVRAGFSDPVLETERLTIEYPTVAELLRDLRGIGAQNSSPHRRRGLTHQSELRRMIDAYEKYRRAGTLPATYEVVYAHAWSQGKASTASQSTADPAATATFPLEKLRRRQR